MKELREVLIKNNAIILGELIERYCKEFNYELYIAGNTNSKERIIRIDRSFQDEPLQVFSLRRILESIKEILEVEINESDYIEMLEKKIDLNTVNFMLDNNVIESIDDQIIVYI